MLDVEAVEKEDRLRLATEASDSFAWEIDIKAKRIAWSGNSHRILNCDPKEIPDNPSLCFFFAAEQDRPRLLKDLEAFNQREDIDEYELDFSGLSKNDEETTWHLKGKLSRDEFGALSRAFATTKNVTKQKAAQRDHKRPIKYVTVCHRRGVLGAGKDTGRKIEGMRRILLVLVKLRLRPLRQAQGDGEMDLSN